MQSVKIIMAANMRAHANIILAPYQRARTHTYTEVRFAGSFTDSFSTHLNSKTVPLQIPVWDLEHATEKVLKQFKQLFTVNNHSPCRN